MARLAWAHLCETAFLDDCGRLCLIGVTARFPVPSLPIAVHHLMLAAHLVEVCPGDEFEVAVAIQTPSGIVRTPAAPDSLEVEITGEHVLVTLRNLPLVEEGIYRFGLSIGTDGPLTVEIPVLLVSSTSGARVH